MAGIGFELKKLFRRKGLFASLRAYGYAGIICTGPMLLGVLLQLGILLLCSWAGAPRDQQDLLVCMITYTLLFSLTVTSFFSMPVTRYLADMLYEEQEQTILPSFWGSSSMMLVLGCTLYGLFLLVSGATLLQGLLCLWLFAEMIVNWNAMSYLTAIKDYRGILCSFLAAIVLAFGLGFVLVVLLGCPVLEGMLFAVTMGYGLMMVWDVVLLYRYFPQSEESPWAFLRWVDAFLPLAFTGLCTNIGLFAHLVICWAGPSGVQVKGLFYGAPYYDVPALIAFLTILVTSVNFVVSVEVNYNYYWESYRRPMPFYIGIPQAANGQLHLNWDPSYNFKVEEICYTVELAKDYLFNTVFFRQENLILPELTMYTLPAGQYFLRVRATNASGYTQDAFDYYVTEAGKHYGMICFYVQPDGSIVEDTYEE